MAIHSVTNFRRFLITLLAATAVVAVVPTLGLASAQDVIRDYDDDGAIQGCYSNEDFNAALRQIDPNDASYETAPDVIRLAQARCAESGATPEDDGGSGAGVWIGIIVAVALVALGAGALSRRRGGGGPDGANADAGPGGGGDSDSGGGGAGGDGG